MKNEKGITLISMIITVMLMALLIGLIIRASNGNELINRSREVSNNLNSVIEETDNKIQKIEEEWEGVL